jgi:hypothetical protein
LSIGGSKEFIRITEDWYEGYFRSREEGGRKLQSDPDFVGIRDMSTIITMTDQEPLPASLENGRPFATNTITYDQTISYVALDSALKPEEYIVLPFLDLQENENYRTRLAESISAFRNVKPPIPRPVLASEGGDDGLSTGAFAGIIVGTILVFLLAGLRTRDIWKKLRRDRPADEPLRSTEPTAQLPMAYAVEDAVLVPEETPHDEPPPDELPTFKGQTRSVHHGPRAMVPARLAKPPANKDQVEPAPTVVASVVNARLPLDP